MPRKMKLLFLLTLLLLLPVGGCWVVTNPVYFRPQLAPAPAANSGRLAIDVRYLAGNEPGRSSAQRASLNRAATYIADSFAAAGCAPRKEEFTVDNAEYRNVVCSFGPADAPRLVIGAHYDIYESPGADDNASGVAALIELARMVGAEKPTLEHRLDLVAFTLEEPPYFRTENMGSHAHARGILDDGADLKLMISVEMIGFYSDAPDSQSYPVGFLDWLYPDKANFIGVVGALFDRSAVARVKGLLTVSDALPVYSINAPTALTGVDFSDHWSFWQNGLPALMVTDTAFLRNPNYHRPTDTPDTLDYRRMALAVDGLYQVAVGY
jgi:hypothetical protein